MHRFVLDTDVIVAAMRSPNGASAALLGAVLDRRLTMLASVPLFFEYETKCTDPVQWTAAGMSREQADIFINGIAALVLPVKTHYLWRPMLRDPNDEMVLETERFFSERAKQADMKEFRAILFRPGGEPPGTGDELG